jgi:hypothetical protein
VRGEGGRTGNKKQEKEQKEKKNRRGKKIPLKFQNILAQTDGRKKFVQAENILQFSSP